jgi:hypothetical protein
VLIHNQEINMLRQTISILVATLLTACTAMADVGTHADVSVINRSTGETLPLYRHHGRYYVEGKAGDRYAIQMCNRTGGRLLTVLSVDGVNAVTGQTAAASQNGYVLSPWSSAEIAGWRKDMNEVAAFYFTALGDSYAARTGRPDNVGVIGVAIYKEYVEPLLPQVENSVSAQFRSEASGRLAAQDAAGAPAPAEFSSRSKAMAEEKIGTGHGERIHAPTQSTEFRRASSSPSEVITIYYDSRTNLIAQGVIPRRPRMPQPFPNTGFVPDPS